MIKKINRTYQEMKKKKTEEEEEDEWNKNKTYFNRF